MAVVDEDFWINPVAPVLASLLWLQPAVFGFDVQDPAGSLFVSARATQISVEVTDSIASSSINARVTQVAPVVLDAAIAKARVTQVSVEVLDKSPIKIVVAPFIANFPNTGPASYLGHTFFVAFPDVPTTYWITIFDPCYFGEKVGALLPYFAETTPAKKGKIGYTYAGKITVLPTGGAIGTEGGSAGP